MLGGCAPDAASSALDSEGITPLSPRRQLIRASVDLRGVHPSETELAFIDANPGTYGQFVERYLDDERFVERVQELFNEVYLTRTGTVYFSPDDAGLGMISEALAADAMGEEPLQLIGHIVREDLPFTEVVTADYTMGTPVLSGLWGMTYPTDASGWQPTHYTDGRPHAGVLSMTTMWQRYPSAGVNANRHRANQVSRILLCDDYLSRPVSFSRSQIDALTAGDPQDVIRDNDACQSCHSSLDPLAAHFFGFWWEIDGDGVDQTTYYPEDEGYWRDYAEAAPGYFGTPTSGLVELGQAIAEDERFVDCAVRTVFEGFTQRDMLDADWTEFQHHRSAFVDSGLVVRELVRSIVSSPGYLAGAADDEDLSERLATVKTASPSQLAGIIEETTEYTWTFEGRDALRKNALGLAVLSGGIDSVLVTQPNREPSVGVALVHERLAQNAAWHVATHDLDPERTEDAILLRFVNRDGRPDTDRDAFRSQIEHLFLVITGVPLVSGDLDVEAPEVQQLIDLWMQLYSVQASPEAAWAGVTSAVLRDPMVLFY
jgi:hypothetical protein